MRHLWNWFRVLISGKPHFYIGGEQNPYLMRWFLIPKNPFLNVFLHKFVRDDDDRALHDHPWPFCSIMIRGKYLEVTGESEVDVAERYAPSICFRRANHKHRVVLWNLIDVVNDKLVSAKIPCWTIIVTGPQSRTWGFWCKENRFVPWYDFVDLTDEGKVGKGCD